MSVLGVDAIGVHTVAYAWVGDYRHELLDAGALWVTDGAGRPCLLLNDVGCGRARFYPSARGVLRVERHLAALLSRDAAGHELASPTAIVSGARVVAASLSERG